MSSEITVKIKIVDLNITKSIQVSFHQDLKQFLHDDICSFQRKRPLPISSRKFKEKLENRLETAMDFSLSLKQNGFPH